ncbi:hypothetical protein M2344_001774 [Sphingobium sp. B8D3C]|nr:hypothetical protein [Sphingobium sp. B8D3B]MCW2418812.1 hypothetical protein [Sphingobium sp. B8D3C]
MCSTWNEVPLMSPHRPVKWQCMQEHQFHLVAFPQFRIPSS